MADVTLEQVIEERARVIDPGAWVEDPPGTYTGLLPKGTARNDAIKQWWHGNGDRRRKARISARATIEADRPLFGMDITELAAQLAQREANCAELREALNEVAAYPNIRTFVGTLIHDKITIALASPHPGAKLLAELEMVKKKLWEVWREDCHASREAKMEFFAALEE